jgi:hypothetical protein
MELKTHPREYRRFVPGAAGGRPARPDKADQAPGRVTNPVRNAIPVSTGVEPNECGEEPPIGFRRLAADEETVLPEPLFQPIETFEQRHDRGFVGLLRAGEACLVHRLLSVVDGRVRAIDLGAQRSRIIVARSCSDAVAEHDLSKLLMRGNAAERARASSVFDRAALRSLFERTCANFFRRLEPGRTATVT